MNPRAATIKRLSKPLLLLAPLAFIIVVPAAVYGFQSRVVAAEANDALIGALVQDESGGFSVDTAFLCRPEDDAKLTTEFADLGVDEQTHKYSVSGIGFSTVVVDLKGWSDRPDQSGSPTPAGTELDERDDIALEVELFDDRWCVFDVRVQTAAGG